MCSRRFRLKMIMRCRRFAQGENRTAGMCEHAVDGSVAREILKGRAMRCPEHN